jgi:FkbM family methyltransferase
MKSILYRIFELEWFKFAPRGLDPYHNFSRYLPKWRCTTVFDVGANVGQSAETFVRRFPAALVHSFEPFPTTFEELRRNTAKLSRVSVYPYALSSSTGTVFTTQGDCSTNNTITDTQECSTVSNKVVPIQTRTVTQVFQELDLKSISLLKIDTEGHDLAVLHGAAELLDRQVIDVIHVETGMNPTNHHHIPLEMIKSYLESKNYFLFGIYEQTSEFMTGHPAMRRCNSVFISAKVNEANHNKMT